MNETGNYPGQAWLWLYTFWYQIPPYNTSANADALILVTMGILSAVLVLFPFIPYFKRLPYSLGVHRLIWREYYSDVRQRGMVQSVPAEVHKVEDVSPEPDMIERPPDVAAV